MTVQSQYQWFFLAHGSVLFICILANVKVILLVSHLHYTVAVLDAHTYESLCFYYSHDIVCVEGFLVQKPDCSIFILHIPNNLSCVFCAMANCDCCFAEY